MGIPTSSYASHQVPSYHAKKSVYRWLAGGVEIAGVASSAPSWLFDFAPADFNPDRKLRHFDRKQERELAGCEGLYERKTELITLRD
ncbi:hypothetical protein KFK09_000685 [Dendrobium nobile]|uniref:Uncharacterized protein n=1 Tax=Dendrobium nobile TaxID=94219 RepID=A0A8T3CFG7_DENNO|nr:hypothetical protein KFK09_000685 [Dendrobium nobile]